METETLAPLDPGRSGVVGNTPSTTLAKSKQCPLRKNHFGTIFYDSYDQIDPIIQVLKKHSFKGVAQSETCPTTQKKHLQVAIWCENKCRDTSFRIPNSHWEAVRNDQASYEYCKKDESFNGDCRVEWGFPKPIKLITELYPWQQGIIDMIKQEPDDRAILWIYEREGNKGKTALCKLLCAKHNAIFCDGAKKADIINMVFNADMDKHNCVIWDLTRSQGNRICYDALEAVKNGMISNTKYETGMKLFNSPHVLIFANELPDTKNLSYDRWHIYEITNQNLEQITL